VLIVSKFHDYYDTAIAYGIDKECVYNRKTEELNKPKHPRHEIVEFNNKDYSFKFTTQTIGFCGDIYRCIIVKQQGNYSISDEIVTLAFYDAKSVIEYMKEHKIGLSGRRSRWRWNSWSRNNWNSEEEVNNYYEREIKQETYDIFQELKVPVFLLHGNCRTINPCLKDFKFGKIKDSVTTFQEIHQYIAGVLGTNENETVEITDKVRSQQHGYDKWSFRTMPGDSKKAKKRRNKKV